MSHLISIVSHTFSILGMIISFIVFLSPVPTFYKIYKKKSTEGYQSIPYMVALFSAMLMTYYAPLQGGIPEVVIINVLGVVIETIYIGLYLFYAPKKARVQTIKVLLLFVVGGFGAIALVVQFLLKGRTQRTKILGYLNIVFSVCTFAAPLCIVRKVIKTKSVEYMPLLLTVFLTLNSVMWFVYGLLIKNPVIYSPNILGFIFSILQIVLYMMYKKKDEKKEITKEQTLPELLQNHVIILDHDGKKLPHLTEEQIIDIWKLGSIVYSEKLKASATRVDEINKPQLQTVQT